MPPASAGQTDTISARSYAERNGEVLLDEVVRVNGDVITVDEDAAPGNGDGVDPKASSMTAGL